MAKKDKKDKKKKKSGLSLNFKGVKTFKTIPEGSYVVEVVAATMEESSKGNDMIKWEFEVAEGPHKGAKLWYNSTITDDSLWALRQVLDALGQDVPDGEMDIDLEELVGCQAGVGVLHDTYEGKRKAVIADWMSKDDVESSDDEDEAEEDEDDEDDKKSKKKDKKKSKKDDDDEDEAEEEETPDVDNMDEDELKELIDEAGLDVDLDDYKTLKKQRNAVKEALEGGSDDEADEEESDEETYTEDQIDDMDSDELQKLNDDLDLGLDDLADEKPKKARKAVLKALKKKGLLEG